MKDEEFRLGKTKVFIRQPTTLFYFEELREKKLPLVIARIQAAWRGYKDRTQWEKRKAIIRIQLWFKRYRFRRYFVTLRQAFANVKQEKYFGKYVMWPVHPRVLDRGVNLLHKIHDCWRVSFCKRSWG